MSTIFSLLSDWVLPISNVCSVLVSLLFSTKIKDFFSGIPADLRKDLSAIESAALAKVAGAQKSVIAELTPAPAPILKPAAPAAPVAPAAPAAV